MRQTVWECKIGVLGQVAHLLPAGADSPMREAVARRFERVLGMPSEFTFSGWGATLTEGELAVVEDRLPDRSKVTRPVPLDVTDEMIERGARALAGPNGHWTWRTRQANRKQAAAVLRAALEAPE